MLKSDLLTPACWNDYELLDSGNFEKLERFGRYVVAVSYTHLTLPTTERV